MAGAYMANDDPISLALEEIRERGQRVQNNRGNAGGLLAVVEARNDIPRLIATVSALTEGHDATQTYAWMPEDGKPCACGHDDSSDCHFESNNGEWLCRCQPEGFVCGICVETLIDTTAAEWPCDVHTTAAKALLGEDAGDA
jgi:hypothetical protein